MNMTLKLRNAGDLLLPCACLPMNPERNVADVQMINASLLVLSHVGYPKCQIVDLSMLQKIFSFRQW